jgi:hypothetical protein
MSYTNPSKAIALAHELADKLKVVFAGKTVAESYDTDGNPLISVNDGSPAAGEANLVIKVAPISWPLAKDVIGQSANIYSPSVIQLVTEANPTGGAGADILTAQQLLWALGLIVLRGTAVEWYQSANGVAPTAAAIIAGNLKATWQPDLYFGMTSQQ